MYHLTADKLEMEFSFLAFAMTVPHASRFSRYVAVFLRWLLIGLSVFALTVWLGLYIRDHVLSKTYTATAVIQIPAADMIIPAGSQNPTPDALQPVFENTIRAPDFLLPIIKSLDLETAWANHLENSAQDQVPDVDALTRLENMLSLTAGKEANLVTIVVLSSDPQQAADIANAVAEQYQTLRVVGLTALLPENPSNQQDLLDQMDKQQKVVDDKKAEVEKLRAELASTAIPGTVQIRGDTEKRRNELQAAQTDYHAREALQAKVEGVSDDAFIQALAGAGETVTDFNHQLAVLRGKTPPNQAEISNFIARYRRAMKINLDMAKTRAALLREEVNTMTEMTVEQSPELRQALIDLDQEQSQLDLLTARSKSTESAAAVPRPSLVQIIDRAAVPAETTYPNKALDFVVIIAGATVMAILAASFAEVVFLLVRASQRTDN